MEYKFIKNYRLNQIQHEENSSFNWLFLPGGPGMGSEYLIDFAKSLELHDNIFIADFPGDGSNHIDERIDYQDWKEGLLEVTKNLNPCILVTHSFSGMFALTIPELEENLKGIVIMSSTPDRAWMQELAYTARNYNLPDVSSTNIKFYTNPTVENLKSVFYASIPYQFLPHEEEKGKILLEKCSFNPKTRQWGDYQFHTHFTCQWIPQKIATMIIGSHDDRLLPMKLWEKHEEFIRGNIKIIELTNTGHFPWISKLAEIKKELSNFYKTI